MPTLTTEQQLRREAVRRHLQGERPTEIGRALQRSRRWVYKWWDEYLSNPLTDFAEHSRTPHHSPTRIPAAVAHAVIEIRQALEAAQTPETQYGLIGNRAIAGQLERFEVAQVPSLAALQRILQREGLTHPIGRKSESAYYPWPEAWAVNAIHASDIITRHIRGGEAVQNFHTLDHVSHMVALSQAADKRSLTMQAHLQHSWAHLGLPSLEQLDNEGAFCGGHTHPGLLGQVVRLCLFAQVEVLFTPIYEAKRNYQIESFHSLWLQAFWMRQQFVNAQQVQREVPKFLQWYHSVYQPPSLNGQTPQQRRQQALIQPFTSGQQQLIPSGRLPVTAGRVHVMRKVKADGQIALFNQRWLVGRQWVGEYVRATLNTAKQQLTIWHKADARADWRLLKTRPFRFKESVVDVLPAFRRKCARCLDYLPG